MFFLLWTTTESQPAEGSGPAISGLTEQGVGGQRTLDKGSGPRWMSWIVTGLEANNEGIDGPAGECQN